MYEKNTLSNGVRIVYEKMPHVRSAAVGIWIGTGSRNEKAGEGGCAHFIEHMLFKGTSKHTAAELAGMMDALGGQINAFTNRESTCYWARVLDNNLDTAIYLLGEMFFDSSFAEEDIENERGVILEEIDMYNDTPEDLVVERLFKEVLQGPLGRPVLGTPGSLAKLDGSALAGFMRRNYAAPRIVVSLCGSFNKSHIRHIESRFKHMDNSQIHETKACGYRPAFVIKRKNTEQNHLFLAFKGVSSRDPDRFAMHLLSNMLGGGMSSRLFQTLREKYGLCYSISSFNAGLSDAGVFGVSTALGRESEKRALELIFEELLRFREEGVTIEELNRAREQVKSNLMMMLESTSSRMNKLGSGELIHGYSMSPDELINRYDEVGLEKIRELAARTLRREEFSFSALGRVGAAQEYRDITEGEMLKFS